MIREIHQLEAKLAFGIAVAAQCVALLVPGTAEPALLWQVGEDLRQQLARNDLKTALINGSLFLGPNLLRLVSPFLTRVYGQSQAVLWLAIILSFIINLAVALLFLDPESRGVYHYAFLIAAAAHMVGLFRVREERPDEDELPR